MRVAIGHIKEFLIFFFALNTVFNITVNAQCNAVGGYVTTEDSTRCINEATLLTLHNHDGDITWQSSPSGLNTWSAVTSDTSSSVYVYPMQNTDYRAHVTIPGCNDDFSTIVTINVLTAGLTSALGTTHDECDTSFVVHADSPTGSWSKKYGPGNTYFSPSSTFTDPTVATDSFGLYIFVWTDIAGGCVASNITNYPQNKASAIDSIQFCWSGSKVIQMAATLSDPDASGTWTPYSGAVTITDPTSPDALIEPDNVGAYKVLWTENYHACTDDTIITILIQRQPVSAIGNIPTVCDSINILDATDTWGSVNYWQQVSGPGKLSFIDSLSINTQVNASEYGEYSILWTTENYFCSDTEKKQIIFLEQPITKAINPDDICGLSADLTGLTSAHSGSVTRSWYWISGPAAINSITTINDSVANVQIINPNYGLYNFRWKEQNGICSDSTDVGLTFFEQPVARAGSDIDSCGRNVQLNAIQSVTGSSTEWSVLNNASDISFGNASSPSSTASSSAYNLYNFIWTETNAICVSHDTVNVEFIQIPVAYAGADDSVCGPNYTLSATRSITGSTGNWTYENTGSQAGINDPTAFTTGVSASDYTPYNFIFTETNRICKSSDTVTILFVEIPSPDAGVNDSVCGQTYKLNATKSIAASQAHWSVSAGTTNITYADSLSENSNVSTNQYGPSKLIWTEKNRMCPVSDTVSIKFIQIPQANAGTDGDTCGLNYQLNATTSIPGTQGTWGLVSAPDTSVVSNDKSYNTTVDTAGSYMYVWTETNDGCSNSAPITITYLNQPKAEILSADNACGNSQQITVDPGNNSGTWQQTGGTGDAQISPAGTPGLYSVQVSDTGNYSFLYTVSNDRCTDDTAVSMHFFAIPEVDAGTDNDICGKTDTLKAFTSVGKGEWTLISGPGTPHYSSLSGTSDIVSVDKFGQYIFNWTAINGGCESSDRVTINFISPPVSDAGINDIICGKIYKLSASPTTGFWKVLSGPGTIQFSPDTNSSTATLHTEDYGMYKLQWNALNGICSDTSSLELTFLERPVADAGPDQNLNNRFETDFAANPLTVTQQGLWELLTGNGDVVNPDSATTHVTSLSLGSNSFLWTVTNGTRHKCQSSDTLNVIVYDIFVPEVITPNGDGVNDKFVITGIEDISPVEITIFNRWGIEVYYSADYKNNWDGTNKSGEYLTNDTYFYVLNIAGSRIIKGFVVIKR